MRSHSERSELFEFEFDELFEFEFDELLEFEFDELFEFELDELFEFELDELFEFELDELFEFELDELFEFELDELFELEFDELLPANSCSFSSGACAIPGRAGATVSCVRRILLMPPVSIFSGAAAACTLPVIATPVAAVIAKASIGPIL